MNINPLQFPAISKKICSKEKWLHDYGIDIEGRMRLEGYERSISFGLEIKQKMEARKGYCACYLFNDIGVYNACPHLGRYCYTNGDRELVAANCRDHGDNSPLLIGHLAADDQLREAK